MSRIGKTIIDRLSRFAGDLERGVDVAQTYTGRQIVLDLAPRSSLPSEWFKLERFDA